jgi:hypothetical protein
MNASFKSIIMHGFSAEEAIAIMRAVKAASISPDPIAFATTTPTSLGWSVEDLLEHLEEEQAARRPR